ncbi:MAG: efflux RND transporter periplasmic adaptor subunit [Verrucomicrobia bacterium]|nr:efflux RND transporter periplasmic adaptor subunit [Verrucomicrobiota bacterium]NDA66872.1 efflux RND transporter periplasmic adaptor subunit [Verrucomicrobiota bacterium]NDE98559.1 efflux RND transporter periplasmic adaptor subunit [Verrucomicrobiota bacterium]
MNPPESPPAADAKPALAAPSPSSGKPVPTAPKVHLFLWAVVFLALFGLAFVAGLLPRQQQRAALALDTKELAIPTVTVASAKPANAPPTLSIPAEIRPLTEAPIHARASGYLKRWLVDLGAKVEAGQLLAEIDTPELNQEIAQARAQLAQTQASLDLAKITAARWAELLKTASVSEQEAAEKKADLALKLATVEAARANVRRLEELQSFDRVLAPFAGVITARRVDVGDLIKADTGTELFRLAETHKLRVFVRVPQSVAPRMVSGVAAELRIQELPGRTFTAKVARTAGLLAADSRTLLTELEVDNARGEILSGSFAQVTFPDDKPAAALTLAANTLIFHAEGTLVGVVRADNTVELRRVKLGRDFGPVVEIAAGITESDRVILNPADSLVAGATVRVLEPVAVETK